MLAGGTGSRLHPLTLATSKQLLPVYDKPMVYYPLSLLMLAGIDEILIITTAEHQPAFRGLLGDGSQWGVTLAYGVQDEPNGIAEALLIAEEFLGGRSCALVLGDNLFHGSGLSELLQKTAAAERGAQVIVQQVKDPERYGVVTFDEHGRATGIAEKPDHPQSPWAITGLYFFDERAAEVAHSLQPSPRGELEITSVIEAYMHWGELEVVRVGRGVAWLDTGTFASMVEASEFVRVLETRQRLTIGSPEEVAFHMGFIDAGQLRALAEPLLKSGYGQALLDLAEGN